MTAQENEAIAALRREMELQFDGVRVLFEEREKRYMERFDAQDESVKTALISAKEAVLKAEIATEKRFENARLESEGRMSLLEKEANSMALGMGTAAGRSGGIASFWGYLVGAAGIGAAIVGIAMAWVN